MLYILLLTLPYVRRLTAHTEKYFFPRVCINTPSPDSLRRHWSTWFFPPPRSTAYGAAVGLSGTLIPRTQQNRYSLTWSVKLKAFTPRLVHAWIGFPCFIFDVLSDLAVIIKNGRCVMFCALYYRKRSHGTHGRFPMKQIKEKRSTLAELARHPTGQPKVTGWNPVLGTILSAVSFVSLPPPPSHKFWFGSISIPPFQR